MAIKRSREDMELERSIAMANYLIFLSQGPYSESRVQRGRVFECKTCNKQFQSFQALGGHRASHKRPRQSGDVDHNVGDHRTNENAGKPKLHECSICGLEFALGQALGGHMRRHKTALTGSQVPCSPTLSLSLGASRSSGANIGMSSSGDDRNKVVCLDLNLTPLENSLLEVRKLAPVYC